VTYPLKEKVASVPNSLKLCSFVSTLTPRTN